MTREKIPMASSLKLTSAGANTSTQAQIPVDLIFQERRKKYTTPLQCGSTPWDKFSTAFERPMFLGEKSLEQYLATYEDILESEYVDICMWRPILTEVTDGPHTPQNMKGIFAIVFDIEHNMPLHEIQSRLSGIKALVHSTYRHCPVDQRWRVIIPLKSLIQHADWSPLMEHFQLMFDGHLGDIYNHSPYHWFNYSACPHDAVEHYTMILLEGDVFNGVRVANAARIARSERGWMRVPQFTPDAASVTQPSQGGVITAEIPDLADDDQMEDAQNVIAQVMSASKTRTDEITITEPANPTKLTSPEVESISSLDITAAIFEINPELALTDTAQYLYDNYEVPDSESEDDPTTSQEKLMSDFESLVHKYKRPNDYLLIRNLYFDISIRLNLKKLWAPAFRHDLNISSSTKMLTPAQKLIQRDRVVIDCHWLHSQGFIASSAVEKQWRPLFKAGEPFPFWLAAEFACKNLLNSSRAEGILRLTELEQFQLRSICGNEVKNRVININKFTILSNKRIPSIMDSCNLMINRWCENDIRIKKYRERYIAHAHARALLAIVPSKNNAIAKLAGMIQGVPALSDGAVGSILKNLDAKLAKSV